MPSPLKPVSDLIEHPGSGPVNAPNRSLPERYPQAPEAITDRTCGKQFDQEPEVLDELIIVTLKWRGSVKRVFLGVKKRPGWNESRKKAWREISLIGKRTTHWTDFLARAYVVLNKCGFTRVDL
jgi:hypothetical protein